MTRPTRLCRCTSEATDALKSSKSASVDPYVLRQMCVGQIMRKIYIFPLIGLMAIFLTGCDFPKIAKLSDSATPETQKHTNQILINADSISPKEIIVQRNTKVTFTNKDKGPHTIASDPHPTHNQIQNLYSTPIFKDQTYSYTFTKVGKFGFHLEDNPSISGEIVVE